MKKLALITTTALFSTGALAEAPSYSYVEARYGAKTIEHMPNVDDYLEHHVDGGTPLDRDAYSDFDVDEWSLSGSFAVSDNLHVFGGYSVGTGDIYDVSRSDYGDSIPNPDFETGGNVSGSYDSASWEGELDTESFTIGLGYHGRFFSDNTTWHANIGYVAGTRDVKDGARYSWMSKVAVLEDDGSISRESDESAIFEMIEDADGNPTDDPVLESVTASASEKHETDEDGMFYGVGLRSNITNNLELNGGVGFYKFGNVEFEQVTMGAVYTFDGGIGVTADICASEDHNVFGVGIRYTF